MQFDFRFVRTATNPPESVRTTLRALLFGVQPTDPITLAGTTTLLLAIVLAACLIPAARAIRIPPASALRAER
jgi:ABC-type lipoprotein release transport system permease subunit